MGANGISSNEKRSLSLYVIVFLSFTRLLSLFRFEQEDEKDEESRREISDIDMDDTRTHKTKAKPVKQSKASNIVSILLITSNRFSLS